MNVCRLHGVTESVYGEGTHLRVLFSPSFGSLQGYNFAPFQIPWLETPIVFDIRAKPRSIASLTGTKGEP